MRDNERIFVFLGAGGDLRLLPAFVDHYKRLGAYQILVNLHFSGKEKNASQCFNFVEESGATLAGHWHSPGLNYNERLNQRNSSLSRFVRKNDWVINADIDEFQVISEDLDTLLTLAIRNKKKWIRGHLVDRVHINGEFPILEPKSIWRQFQLEVNLTEAILGGDIQKVAISKGDVFVNGGHHKCLNRQLDPLSYPSIPIHHFKWDSEVIERLRRRVQTQQSEGQNWWHQSDNFLKFIRNGRIPLQDPRLKVRVSKHVASPSKLS